MAAQDDGWITHLAEYGDVDHKHDQAVRTFEYSGTSRFLRRNPHVNEIRMLASDALEDMTRWESDGEDGWQVPDYDNWNPHLAQRRVSDFLSAINLALGAEPVAWPSFANLDPVLDDREHAGRTGDETTDSLPPPGHAAAAHPCSASAPPTDSTAPHALVGRFPA